jgi:hypothetical protein
MTDAEPKKRGRKSKKVEQAVSVSEPVPVVEEESIQLAVVELETKHESETNLEDVLKTQQEKEKEQEQEEEKEQDKEQEQEKVVTKKRGRKPKGGKIIQQAVPVMNAKENKPNVILHLKCFLKDLQHNNMLQNVVDNYTFPSNKNELAYEIIPSVNQDKNCINQIHVHAQQNHNHNKNSTQYCTNDDNDDENEDDYHSKKDNSMREVWKKLKTLEHNLHLNNIADKKSACFWCTCEFDNPPVYIPKFHLKDSYHVYGCFCSPECAVAHLMDENIDSSAKFERYYLLNHIYTKVYDYTKNIKPAPNPYYMLDKYYGNLSIQEFRSLLRNERLFLIVDKPLTRILPELHEDNDDFIINNKIIPSNTYQVKKKIQRKQQTKTTIMNENFGMSASSAA